MIMDGDYYTLASWHVRTGAEEEFLRVWRDDLAAAFTRANPQSVAALVQSLEDPQQFYSFGPWRTLEEMEEARTDPDVREAVLRILALCDRAQPQPCRVVSRVP